MRDCWGALGLPSTMPAEPPALLPPGRSSFSPRLRPRGLVNLKCPAPSPQTPPPTHPGQLLPQKMTQYPGPPLSPPHSGLSAVPDPQQASPAPPATLELNHGVELQEPTALGFPPKS